MKVHTILAASLIAGALAAPALAQQGGQQMTPEQRMVRFDTLDIDKNGQLTKEEWLPSIPDQMKDYADQIWAMMDTGGKGSVTKEQYANFRPQRPG